MFVITQAFLDLFPNWATAGWQVGDQLNIVAWLSSLNDASQNYINQHPPHRPGG